MANLLAFLSKSMTIQTENLVSEALTYVLQRSPEAELAFRQLLQSIDPQLSSQLHFQNQVYSDDNAIPDLIGFDKLHQPICIVEAKFWAGLTDNQPCTYIDRLPTDVPSILLFVAPDKRLDTLWWELKARSATQCELNNEQNHGAIRYINLSTNRKLAVVSWAILLDSILEYFQKHDVYQFKNDVQQIHGLCKQMDSDAFLPLKSEELSPEIPRRILQYNELVDEIVNRGTKQGFFNTDKLRPSATSTGYGRYFRLTSYCCYLKIDLSRWYKSYNTPFWLAIYGKEWKSAKERRKVKQALFSYNQSGKLHIAEDETPHIAITLPLRSEKEHTVTLILDEIKGIRNILDAYYIGTS